MGDFTWVQKGEVKALHASFDVDFSQCASAGAIREYHAKWDHYVLQWNRDASSFANGAWHTSQLWPNSILTTASATTTEQPGATETTGHIIVVSRGGRIEAPLLVGLLVVWC